MDISKSPLVKVYNGKFKTLLNKVYTLSILQDYTCTNMYRITVLVYFTFIYWILVCTSIRIPVDCMYRENYESKGLFSKM